MVSIEIEFTLYDLQLIKDYNQEVFTVDHITSFTQLNESNILKGSKQKLFVCYYVSDRLYVGDVNQGTREMDIFLRNNKQRVITLHNPKLHSNAIYNTKNYYEYDISTEEGMELLMDLLVDAGCK